MRTSAIYDPQSDSVVGGCPFLSAFVEVGWEQRQSAGTE